MATRPNAFSQPVSHAPIDTSLTIGAEQAADAVLEQCVAIICRQCGFDTVTRSALELLKRLVSTYWEELLEEAARDAELAGRPRPNLNDVRRSLEIYGLIQAIDSDTALLSNSANEPSTSRSTEIDTKPPSTHRRKKSKITSPIEPTSTNKPTARIAMADTLKQELLKNNGKYTYINLV
ncbi:Bromodomain associated-domain-containing protein [Syncephalis fuscata]|nr:Bromodomain associated-domain-containing protein [Syncephalis fuscata]